MLHYIYICNNLQNENLILKTSLSFKNICDCCLIKLISQLDYILNIYFKTLNYYLNKGYEDILNYTIFFVVGIYLNFLQNEIFDKLKKLFIPSI